MSDKYSKDKAVFTWVVYFTVLAIAFCLAGKISLFCEGRLVCWATSTRNEHLEPWHIFVAALVVAGLIASMVVSMILANRKK